MIRFQNNIRLLDAVLVLALLAAGVLLTARGAVRRAAVVSVTADGVSYEYAAKADGVYRVQGALGVTTFEIKDGRVRIVDSPCPNKLCVQQGWHTPLVCLPNNVLITLEAEEAFDAVSE